MLQIYIPEALFVRSNLIRSTTIGRPRIHISSQVQDPIPIVEQASDGGQSHTPLQPPQASDERWCRGCTRRRTSPETIQPYPLLRSDRNDAQGPRNCMGAAYRRTATKRELATGRATWWCPRQTDEKLRCLEPHAGDGWQSWRMRRRKRAQGRGFFIAPESPAQCCCDPRFERGRVCFNPISTHGWGTAWPGMVPQGGRNTRRQIHARKNPVRGDAAAPWDLQRWRRGS